MSELLKIKGFTLVNEDKVNRALNGSGNDKGEFVGGVMKADGTYDHDALLAEYDRIGGLIKKGEDKVRTGSFYDFRARKPRAEAAVEFEFRVNGEVIYVPAEKETPNAVKAVKIAAEKVAKVAKKKASK